MRPDRVILALTTGGLLLALVAGCAAPARTARPATEVIDGPAATAPPPAPVAEVPAIPQPPPAACALERVQFAFDSAQLDPAARSALQRAASCLGERRPAALAIEGHCDERGTAGYNLALGLRRAGAVKAYLSDLGVAAAMEPVSFGEELPLVRGDGEAAWGQNRRAELRLPGERRSDGGLVAGR